MATVPTQQTDPTGLAALIIAAATPVITTLGLVLAWSTDLSNLLVTIVTALVNLGVAIAAILRARKAAYAPATVETIKQAANMVRPDLPPPAL